MIGFSIPVYDRFDHLEVIINCLKVQTNPKWKAVIVIDGGYPEGYPANANDDRIIFLATDKRYNDWGHTPRNIGKNILANYCSYVVMTGDDNYYTPNAVDEMQKAAEGNPGMIYWDMVHSHYDYQYFKCSPGFNQIDIGAFATRSDIAKTIDLSKNFAADGEYVEEYKKKYTDTMIYIPKILYIHN